MSTIDTQSNKSSAAMHQAKATERFSRLDTSGDGKLDDAELQQMAQNISQRTGQQVSVADLKARLDGNGDGSISLDEMKQAGPPRGPRGARRLPEEDELDETGGLSSDIVNAMAANLSEVSGSTISGAELTAKLDKNGDGRIDRTEVSALMAQARMRDM